MPAKMMREMPLPMPRSVICSPIHMMKIVPVVHVSAAKGMNARGLNPVTRSGYCVSQ